MSKDAIDKLAGLGSQTAGQLAFAEEVGRADLTLTALAVAIYVLGKAPPERSQEDLKAMRLLFRELAGEDSDIWKGRAEYLVEGTARD
jgi:hypothetical protein